MALERRQTAQDSVRRMKTSNFDDVREGFLEYLGPNKSRPRQASLGESVTYIR